MAEEKKNVSAILHYEWRESLGAMDDASRGRLMLAMMDFMDDKEPELEGVEKIVFGMMRARLALDKENYDTITDKRSEAGKKGAAARWNDGKPMAKMAKASFANSKPIAKDSKNGDIEVDIEVDNEVDNEIETEKEKDTPNGVRESQESQAPYGGHTPFEPPTLEDVEAYAKEIGATKASPKKFIAHYDGNGWMMGMSPMRDWKAVFRYWEDTEREKKPKPNKFHNFEERPKETSAAKVDFVDYVNAAETAADIAGGTPEEIREAGERAKQEWYAKFMGMAAGGEP